MGPSRHLHPGGCFTTDECPCPHRSPRSAPLLDAMWDLWGLPRASLPDAVRAVCSQRQMAKETELGPAVSMSRKAGSSWRERQCHMLLVSQEGFRIPRVPSGRLGARTRAPRFWAMVDLFGRFHSALYGGDCGRKSWAWRGKDAGPERGQSRKPGRHAEVENASGGVAVGK